MKLSPNRQFFHRGFAATAALVCVLLYGSSAKIQNGHGGIVPGTGSTSSSSFGTVNGDLEALPTQQGSLPTATPGRSADHGLKIPILMYHFVRVNPVAQDHTGFILSVTPSDFSAQMDLLHSKGFHTVNLLQAINAIKLNRSLPPHPVALSFDDGFADFATTIQPILFRYHFTATIFVVPNFLGKPNYMSRAQVVAASLAGFTVGAHTMDHIDLTKAPPVLAMAEILESRKFLQRLTRQSVFDFAYPGGKENSVVATMVEQAGFSDAVTTTEGMVSASSDVYFLPRVRVSGGENLGDFAKSLKIQ